MSNGVAAEYDLVVFIERCIRTRTRRTKKAKKRSTKVTPDERAAVATLPVVPGEEHREITDYLGRPSAADAAHEAAKAKMREIKARKGIEIDPDSAKSLGLEA